MILDRRQLLALLPGLPLLRPGPAWAAGEDERCFLFIYCAGGWDQQVVFAPLDASGHVDPDPGGVAAEVGGLPFVDHPDRPSVRAFFEAHGDRVAVINGIEVPAIAHPRCAELVHTAGITGDDWATALAGTSARSLLMPHVVVSGPSWARRYKGDVVRVGTAGQLPELLSGAALARMDTPVAGLSESAGDRADAFVRARVDEALARGGTGRSQKIREQYARGLGNLADLRAHADALSFDGADAHDLVERLDMALRSFELGLCRCASIQYDGVWGQGWDTHADNFFQSMHFEELFDALSRLLVQLATRSDPAGRPLSERLCVVVFSEMGRNPALNAWGGREHWTDTSAMLIGSGVAGGRVVGGWDAFGMARPVDLASGEAREDGTPLTARHLGATLLALGDTDPGEWLPGTEPIAAVLA